jgi:hypothetical protein
MEGFMSTPESTRECILRALSAAEIAEDTYHPELRRSFSGLAEKWLIRAARSCFDEEAPPIAQPH